MTSFFPYLIKLSISLAVVYLFYQLVLRRLTFYNWNRWYLAIYSVLAFFIPFININPVLERNNWNNLELIPSVSYQLDPAELATLQAQWTVYDWTFLLIGLGTTAMVIRMIIQQLSFFYIRRSAKLLFNDKIKVYQVDKNIIPFSYGNSIFVNQHQHSEEELREIIRHEFIHVKQKHTLDILWGEFLCILNWYNPFAWLIRKSIRQNLEFIADNKVLQNGIDRKQYQYLLLKVIGVAHFSIAPQFNFTSLKKRIAMMNKIQSAKVHLFKFLFILPLMSILLLAFRNQMNNGKGDNQAAYFTNNSQGNVQETQDGIRVDTVPAKTKLPENVRNIKIENEKATVTLKNGTVQQYNLDNEDEEKAFEKKYGKFLAPPLPPIPPTPAKLGKIGAVPAAPAAPVSPAAPAAPVREHVRVKPEINSKGYFVTIADNNGECIVIVKDKAEKIVKAITLNEWNEKEKEHESVYGEIPPVRDAPRIKITPAAPGVPPPGVDHGIIIAPSGERLQIQPVQPVQVKSVNIRLRGLTSQDGISEVLYIIDGVKQGFGTEVLHKLDPETIQSIDVLKGNSARALYGDEGNNGVIIIKTKKNKYDDPATPKKENLNQLKDFKGLMMIDGSEATMEEVNLLNPADIESIDVLKSAEHTSIYGEKGKHGVILIRTKAKKNPVITSLKLRSS